MLLKAKHNLIIYSFFKWYSVWKTSKHFRPVIINGSFHDKGLPVLLISNHVSWWDGFWAMYLNLKVLKRKFHFMMLEEQLKKHWYFNFSGGFSVKKGSRSVMESVKYASDLLRDRNNLVLIFPQGKIQSIHQPEFQFEKGTERIIREHGDQLQVMFLANLTDYFSNSRPGLYMYIREYERNVAELQSAYNIFYKQSLHNQINLAT